MKLADYIFPEKYYLLLVDPDDPAQIHLAVFKKTSRGIKQVEELGPENLASLTDKLPKNSKIIIVISGNKVLTRFSREKPDTLFDEIEEQEFHIIKTVSENGWMIQSACRRSTIEPITDLLTECSLFLLDVSLVPCSISLLETLFENETIEAGYHRFLFRNRILIELEELETITDEDVNVIKYKIGGDTFSAKSLYLLAALFHFLRNGPAFRKFVGENIVQSRYYGLFRRTAIISLSGFFILLLFNFLIFSHLQNHIGRINVTDRTQTEKIEKINDLKAQLSEYKKLSSYALVSGKTSYSYYLDLVAHLRPPGLWFNSFDIHPPGGRIESGKLIQVEHELIRITGEVDNPLTLNGFIGTLKQLDWIEDIELDHYEASVEKAFADFDLEITKK